MNNQNLEHKLTPAAKNALDEIINDYREQLLSIAVRNATSMTGKLEEISIRDLLNAIDEINIKSKDKKVKFRERLIQTSVLAGLVYSLVGITASIILTKENIFYEMSILTAFVGIIVALTATFMLRFRKTETTFSKVFASKDRTELRFKDLSYLFIKYWTEVEITVRDLFSQIFGESNANIPLSSLFKMLNNKGILTNEDINLLKNLLEKRNYILHSGKDYDEEELRKVLYDAEKILEKLRITNNSSRQPR